MTSLNELLPDHKPIIHVVGDNLKSAIVADLADYRRADRNRTAAAIACGDKLALAKADMPHGAWIPFLTEIGLPERTARRWIAIRDWSVEAVEEAGGITKAARIEALQARKAKLLTDGAALRQRLDGLKRKTRNAETEAAKWEREFRNLAAARGLSPAKISAMIEAEFGPEAAGNVA